MVRLSFSCFNSLSEVDNEMRIMHQDEHFFGEYHKIDFACIWSLKLKYRG